METEGPDRAAAAAQLAELRSGRAHLAERAMQPWWYDALLGLLVFALVGQYSLRNSWVTVGILVLSLLGARGLMALYRRTTGFWVNGFRKGRTRKTVRVWVAVYAVVLAVGLAAEYLFDWRGSMVVAAVVLGVAVAVISRWWSRLYIAELREAGDCGTRRPR